MSLFKKVDKVLASFGNIRAMERLHVDTVTEEYIQNIGGDKIAESPEAVIHGGIDELNGYLFLETMIISQVNIKTFKGATLQFIGKSSITLNSDTQEIKSEFSNVSNRFITKVSFDITKEEIQFIRSGNYQEVRLTFKKKTIVLNKPQLHTE